MTDLIDNPELMLEALAVMVKRAGGYVKLDRSETLGPFSLDSAFDEGALHLRLDESLTHEQVNLINSRGGVGNG